MPRAAVHVTAASRLHFGLISLGGRADRQFGGVGIMVEPPRTALRVLPAPRFTVRGPAADRVVEFARMWQEYWQRPEPPNCRLEVDELPPLHSGLGTGTQLGLSIASGLNTFHGLPDLPAEQLAASVRRGKRSAVGTHGFLQGGLIFDQGKTADEPLGALGRRIPFPDSWRLVIVVPPEGPGVCGEAEQRAFAQLSDVPRQVADQLLEEVCDRMLPAVETQDFDAFSDSVYRFGRQTGLSFAEVQGGSYNGPRLTALVQRLRELGVRGVGQSSWGPAIFAACRDHSAAQDLSAALRTEAVADGANIWIAAPRNEGAAIRRGLAADSPRPGAVAGDAP